MVAGKCDVCGRYFDVAHNRCDYIIVAKEVMITGRFEDAEYLEVCPDCADKVKEILCIKKEGR